MSKLCPVNAQLARLALKDVHERSPQARFEHRLHCVVLVGEGHSGLTVARWFDDDPRSVQRWVRRFQQSGVDGLRDGIRPGRPRALTERQVHELSAVLQTFPRDHGYSSERWRSDIVATEVERRFGVTMSRRNCQRLLASLVSVVPAVVAR